MAKGAWTYLHLLFSALCYLTCITIVVNGDSSIASLIDETFEHQTQASTGMTTGSWLVLFQAQHCPHCKALEPHFDNLAQDEELKEAGIVLATADINLNRKTVARFGIRGSPTVIFLHKKMVYTYKGKRDYDSLKTFVLGDFDTKSDTYNARAIPPPPSSLQEYTAIFKAIGLELKDAALGKSGSTGYALICMVGIVSILVIMFMGLIASIFLPAKSSTTKSAKKKKA